MIRLSRRVPLAWKNLTHEPRRLALAVGGISFAVLLMFAQLGFRGALLDSTVQLPKRFNADLLIASRGKYILTVKEPLARRRLLQALECGVVTEAFPLYVEVAQSIYRNPITGKGLPIRVLAFDLDDPALLLPEVQAQVHKLRLPNTALYDAKSKDLYGGPVEGTVSELAGQKITIVGHYNLGTDFADNGCLIMSADNFRRYFLSYLPGDEGLGIVDLGLLKIAAGVDPVEARRIVDDHLPDDVLVFTKDEYMAAEELFWKKSTPIGFVFFFGTAMGFLVGIIICYQILYADIAEHMAEFATLKAMGYRNPYFMMIVLQEALLLSVLGFLPGVVASAALYELLAGATGLFLQLTIQRAVIVLLLTILMCVLSGILAMRKLMTLDPAELF